MSEPRELRIELPTVSIAALQWGPDDGPLALCLHGFPDTAWTWRYLGPALADLGWRVVAPFSRGYAPTSIPTDRSYHIGALMDDAIGIHSTLGGDERAVVIGHDWGAATSNALGAYPETPFRKVVSLAVPPIRALTPKRSASELAVVPRLLAQQLPKSWYTAFVQLPVVPERQLERLVPFLWQRWSPDYDASEDLRHVAKALYAGENRSAAMGYYRAVVRPGRTPKRYRDTHSVWTRSPKVPTLYLHGMRDGCVSVAYADRVGAELPSGSSVQRIDGAGHFLQLEQPDRVNALVAAFIAD